MTSSNRGKNFIKTYEALKLSPYIDSGGIWTIGWGTTYYPNGTKVKSTDPRISEAKANEYFNHDINKFTNIVNSRIRVTLKQNQFDAVLSHTYNTGGSDTLFDLINQKASNKDIRNWFEKHYITVRGKTLNGLIRRRKAEADMYFEGMQEQNQEESESPLPDNIQPQIDIPNIELKIDENNEYQAKQYLDVFGPIVPVIKINEYTIGFGDILSLDIDVNINSVPSFTLYLNDQNYKLRKELNDQKVDEIVIFIGNKQWYIKFIGIITNVFSTPGGETLSFNGILFNEKLYNTIQKSYVQTSVLDIIKDICINTNLGLFNVDNPTLNLSVDSINAGKRYIDYLSDVITKYTDNIWCIDMHYYLHVGSIQKLKDQDVDTYTIKNNKIFDEGPQPIILTNFNVSEEGVESDENKFKLVVERFTPISDIGNKHLNSYNQYLVNNSRELSNVQNNIGLGTLNSNCWKDFDSNYFPFYSNRINKELASKMIKLEMTDVLLEIIPFGVVNLELYYPIDYEKNETPYKIKLDENSSGKKLIIGYNMKFERENESFSQIKQTINVI